MQPQDEQLLLVVKELNQRGIEPQLSQIVEEYPYRTTNYVSVRLRRLVDRGLLELRGKRYFHPDVQIHSLKITAYELEKLAKKYPLAKYVGAILSQKSTTEVVEYQDSVKETVNELFNLVNLLHVFANTDNLNLLPKVIFGFSKEDNDKAIEQFMKLKSVLSVEQVSVKQP
jgi:hypothetical protein